MCLFILDDLITMPYLFKSLPYIVLWLAVLCTVFLVGYGNDIKTVKFYIYEIIIFRKGSPLTVTRPSIRVMVELPQFQLFTTPRQFDRCLVLWQCSSINKVKISQKVLFRRVPQHKNSKMICFIEELWIPTKRTF